jgi:hypothetical protein
MVGTFNQSVPEMAIDPKKMHQRTCAMHFSHFLSGEFLFFTITATGKS